MAMLYVIGYTLSYSYASYNGNIIIILYIINILLAMTILHVMRYTLSYNNNNTLGIVITIYSP